jgi:hypothetical protein
MEAKMTTMSTRKDSPTNMPEVREALVEMCRPFGRIRHWSVESANDGLYRCIVCLGEPYRHALAAETLGGRTIGEAVCLEIRVRR